MDRITLRLPLFGGMAATIGLLLAYATEVGLALSVLIPTLCFLQRRRIHAFLVAFAYYAAASSILIPGAQSFFEPGTTLQLPVSLCAIASTLLALPFAAMWSNDRATWRAPIAVVASVPPPLGIIGWANPLTAAGILFPGTAWFGLIGVLTFTSLSLGYPRVSVAALVIAAVVANALFTGIPAVPSDWEAVDTAFGDISPDGSSILKQYQTDQYIQKRALESHARVIVFPESVIFRWNEATDLFWAPTFARLANSGKTLIFGAGMAILAADEYHNVLIVRGAETGLFVQRIPVPVGMSHPLRSDGMPIALTQPGVDKIAGKRVAFLICYEQFLTWPVLTSARSPIDLVIGVANHYRLKDARIPIAQRTIVSAWARLLGVPMIFVVNV